VGADEVSCGWLFLAYVVLVTFGDDEIALVVRADVHARDDALREAVTGLRWNGTRARRRRCEVAVD